MTEGSHQQAAIDSDSVKQHCETSALADTLATLSKEAFPPPPTTTAERNNALRNMNTGIDHDSVAPDNATKRTGSESSKDALFRYSSANIDQINGAVRINDQLYDIENGLLYRSGHKSTGPDPDKPVASLGPNYTVKFAGQEPMSLADQPQVLMEFRVGNHPTVHRIFGLGPQRVGVHGEHIKGGLVDSEHLLSESARAQSAGKMVSDDYAGTKPFLTGTLAESEHNPFGIGNRTGILNDMQRNLEDQTNLVTHGLNQLFTRGLKEGSLNTDSVGKYIGVIGKLIRDIGVSGTDTRSLAEEGKQFQQQFKDTTKIAALTLLTAPAGAWVSGAATAGRVVLAGRTLTALFGGGAVSAALDQSRDTSLTQTGRNFLAGAGETAVFMMGSPLAGRLKEGASLLVRGGALMGDSAMSTVAFAGTQRLRGDEHALELQNLLPSLGAMIAGHVVGAQAGKTLKNELAQYIKNPLELDRVIHSLQGTVNAGTFGAVSPIYSYTESERQRLEAERGRTITTAELLRDMNWSGLASTMASSSALAALPVAGASPFTHRFTGYSQRRIQEQIDKFVPEPSTIQTAATESHVIDDPHGEATPEEPIQLPAARPEQFDPEMTLMPQPRNVDSTDVVRVNGKFLNSGKELTIGRASGSAVAYDENDLSVSRVHGVIGRTADGQIYIRDLSSSFGTWVNGQRLEPNAIYIIKPTDQIILGKRGTRLILDSQPERARACPPDYVPSTAAIRQSVDYAYQHRMTEKLRPGFQNAGAYAGFNQKGLHTKSHRCSTVFDPGNDSTLRTTFGDVHRRFDYLRSSNPMQLARELTSYTRKALFTTNSADLLAWYDKFNAEHAGKRMMLGEFIKQGKGVCSQQALLLKALADEMGLNATMLRGSYGAFTHSWTTMKIHGKELIFDAALNIRGDSPQVQPNHKPW